jgi:peroxiredoxin (alkyl hydroperoxide reductase subunit C)
VGREVIEVGTEAPDFTLANQDREEFTLSALRGTKAVLIVFYPFAFTNVCTGELNRIKNDLAAFQNDDVQVVSISCDSVYSQRVFALREELDFPLLADYWPHGEVARAYGVFNEDGGFANRGTFLVDRDGIVRFAEMNLIGEGRDADNWLAAIKSL